MKIKELAQSHLGGERHMIPQVSTFCTNASVTEELAQKAVFYHRLRYPL
jgi:hypothetical protein